MYFKKELVNFKEEKRSQEEAIKKNKVFIKNFNNVLDAILAINESGDINQTFVTENENSIFYIRRVKRFGVSYYSLQKSNKTTDYQFEYFYGDAMVNTERGVKKIKEFNVTKDTIKILCFDLSELFYNDMHVLNAIKKVS